MQLGSLTLRFALTVSVATSIATLGVAGCQNSVLQQDLGAVDFAGLDLTGVDLTGFDPGDMSGPYTLTPTTAVQIVVEPGDNGATLLSAIKGARTSVHMTMYLLTASSVTSALIARKQAGKEVKVILNKTFPDFSSSNSNVFSQLKTAGVEVQYSSSMYQYTHEKTVIIDGKTALIMTLNASDSALSGNREFIAVDNDGSDVAEAEALFQADWAGTKTASAGKLITAPDNAETRLVALVDHATKTVDVEGEVFSVDSILQALGRAQKRGVAVRLVLSDSAPTSAQGTAIIGLKGVGIPVRVCSSPYIHAKAIVVDGTLAYVGSENFTANSLENNRELGVLVGLKSEVDKVTATISTDFAAGVAQ